MARARNIKPGFFTNDALGELPALTRLLFAGIWTICDREGRLEDRPKKIRAEVLPYDSCDAEEMLQALEKSGFIQRYEADGKRVIQVMTWGKHQNPHIKEAVSTLPESGSFTACTEPAPDKHSASTMQAPDEAQPLPALAGLIPSSLIPDSSPLIPDSKDKGELPVQAPYATDVAARPSMAGAVCVAMKAAGLASVNPSHPELLTLIDKGADIGLFASAAQECVGKGKGFAYALAMVKGRMADAAALADTALALPQQQRAATETFAERDARNKREAWEHMTGRQWPAEDLPSSARPSAAFVIDVETTETRRLSA